MNVTGPASDIVTTYNDAEILDTSLAALVSQSSPDFEVVFADDGSSQDYAAAPRVGGPRSAHGIQRPTHEKKGFRRARILNRGHPCEPV